MEDKHMWKTIIVEDEPFVRRTIVQLVDWRAMGFEIVGEADDGEMALEQIKVHQPDLVITDILMPGINGIELLRLAKAEGFEGAFVMLTCMNEFEYARQALEYGASGYVLKLSMSQESISLTLDKVKAELSRKERQRSEVTFNQAYTEAWHAFTAHGGELQSFDWKREPVWRDRMYRYLCICSILHGSRVLDQAPYKDWFGMTRDSNPSVHSFTYYGVTTVFCWSDSPLKLQMVKGILPQGPAICSGFVPAEQFPAVWFDVLRQLNSHWYKGRPGLYWLNPATLMQPDSSPFNWKQEMELYHHLEEGKITAALKLLREAWTEMEQKQPHWVKVKEIVSRLANWLQRQYPSMPKEALRQMADNAGHEELLTVVTDTIQLHLKDQAKRNLSLTDHPEVNEAIRYIHEHYEENVTLKIVAQEINMDEKYVSGLFAKKVGEPMIQYLQRVRVDKAKQLLTKTGLTVNEIGERVGFVNANYFYKIFKRRSGLTPNDYRNLYGGEGRTEE
jgi:two-component system response regulator YesN